MEDSVGGLTALVLIAVFSLVFVFIYHGTKSATNVAARTEQSPSEAATMTGAALMLGADLARLSSEKIDLEVRVEALRGVLKKLAGSPHKAPALLANMAIEAIEEDDATKEEFAEMGRRTAAAVAKDSLWSEMGITYDPR